MKRVFVALIIPILLVSLGGLGVSHFTAGTAVRYGLGTPWLNVGFGTYKYKSPWCADQVCAPNSYTLQISTQVFPGWYCWIGFILQNFGTVYAVNVSVPTYTIITGDRSVSNSFIHKEYFYGPWTRNSIPQNVYANVWVPSSQHLSQTPPRNAVLPPPPGNVTPPICLQPSGPAAGSNSLNSMVLWIFLQYPTNAPALCKPIQLVITITATCAPTPYTISSQSWP